MLIKDFCKKYKINYNSFVVKKHRFKNNPLYTYFFDKNKVNEERIIKYYERKIKQIKRIKRLYYRHIGKFKNDRQLISSFDLKNDKGLYNFIVYRFFTYKIDYLGHIPRHLSVFYKNLLKMSKY